MLICVKTAGLSEPSLSGELMAHGLSANQFCHGFDTLVGSVKRVCLHGDPLRILCFFFL